MSDLRAGAGRMAALHAELTDLLGRYSELKASVDQRLRWAVGANPGLQEVKNRCQFEWN